MRPRLFSWIYAPYLLTTLVFVAAISVFTAESASRFFFELSSLELRQSARLAANALKPHYPADPSPAAEKKLRAAVKDFSAESLLRITVIAPDGRVIADNQADPERMENHGKREEVLEALADGEGSARRRSASVGMTTVYEAIALRDGQGRVYALVRTAMPISIIAQSRLSLALSILALGTVFALLVSLIAFFLARALVRPIQRINLGAQDFAAGHLGQALPEEGPEELANLAAAMNRMALELDSQIRAVQAQKQEAEAILNGMSEAVAVIDGGLRVLASNPAFRRLFEEAQGQSLLAISRNTELCDFMAAALKARGPLESSLTLYGEKTRQLRLTSAPIEGGKAVLVLNDLTRLNRLETIRRDFTANVSHELKTPLTSIKAALETLEGEGFSDAELCAKLLSMAQRGIKRLEAILTDLLSLARIEEGERVGVELSELSLDEIVASCLSEMAGQIKASGVKVLRAGEKGIMALGHEGLMRQALSNLVDNALKYAASGGSITVSTGLEGPYALLSVRDKGPGIPERDRRRLFERFYRVDKARSRDSGGTGLGLAIVKHIAKAQGGLVRLESVEAAAGISGSSGSCFSILIPHSITKVEEAAASSLR